MASLIFALLIMVSPNRVPTYGALQDRDLRAVIVLRETVQKIAETFSVLRVVTSSVIRETI